MPLALTSTDLPALNAALNSTSALLLLTGFFFIRRGRFVAHAWCMGAALVTSTLFLGSYLLHKYLHGTTVFVGTPAVRWVYLTILLTHTILAMAIVPMALWTVVRAARRQFAQHSRLARWTLPIWLYVSVTGVVIYFMLYQFSDSVRRRESAPRSGAAEMHRSISAEKL